MTIGEATAAPTTQRLARHILSYREARLSSSAWIVARHCVLDWFAVTLAAQKEPLIRLLREEITSNGPATIVGGAHKAQPMDAALVNGSAAHALDYDDCHHLVGHPTVTVLPAALAIAETERASGQALLRALIAGVETSAAIGSLVLPTHYDRGFHATATLGAFGAAAAAGLLLGLDEGQMTMALGLAGMQAAGLKSMFGTMAKPLQAGKAAANGVLAARLAKRGFTAHSDVLDVAQGFIDTHGRSYPSTEIRLTPPGDTILDTLFKYHAACYLTHSTIEAITQLRTTHALSPTDIAAIDIHVAPGHLKVCNITAPKTGLEVKFSLRHVGALAAFGADTAAIETYSDATATNPTLSAFRDKVQVHGDGHGETAADVCLTLRSGMELRLREDVGIPVRDLPAQQARLKRKYISLAEPVLGIQHSRRLCEAIQSLERADALDSLLQAVERG
jgi:2-methylcitrate dehydratase PrpD